MNTTEQPVVGVYRRSRFDVGSNVPALRTGSLLRRGARVVLLGGQQKVSHDPASRIFSGPVYEVTLDASGRPLRHIVPVMGGIALGSLYNANRQQPSGIVPALNGDTVRVAAGKARVYTHTLPGISPRTRVVEPGDSWTDLADHFSGPAVIVKPVDGAAGKGVAAVNRGELAADLAQRFANQPNRIQVVQERVLTVPWPTSMRAAYPEQNARLHDGTKQEMRMFMINNQLTPLARVTHQQSVDGINRDTDDYVALNELTIPTELYEIAAKAHASVLGAAASTEASGAYDFIYGIRPGDDHGEPGWWLSEVNVTDPELPDPDAYPWLAYPLYDARSDQLIRMAQTGVQ